MTLVLRSLSDIRETPFEKPRPLIEGLVNQGELIIVTGLWDSFKSRISAEMARSVATGQPFLGHFPMKAQGGALIMQQEINKGFYDERILQLMEGTPDNTPLYTHYDPFQFSGKYGNDLRDIIYEYKLKLVVFDPLTMFWPQEKWFDENASAPVSLAISPLLQLRQTGCSFIIVHHDPKPSIGYSGVARGSSVLVNAPDARILLKRDNNEDAIEVRARTRNLRAPSRFKAVLTDEGRLKYRELRRGKPIADERKEAFERFSQGMSAKEVIDATNLPRSTVYMWYKEWEDESTH